MASSFDVRAVQTTVYDGQKPGTSGLRKRVKVFQQEHYTENFIQATLDAVSPDGGAQGTTLVVGGDGRYFLQEAVQKIVKIAAGNKVTKLIIGQHGILSTPAASNLIRKLKADGGILLTASHNPGGPDNDFGIKYNVSNGGPAPESVTNRIYERTKALTTYRLADLPDVDLSAVGTHQFANFTVEIVDSIDEYVALMHRLFDISLIRNFLRARKDSFSVLFDGMHGVTGPYAHRIFVKELGLPETSVMNAQTLPDFGGGHPDPNLTYAHELVERVRRDSVSFGAASDGDGDRNMIISHDWFVTPSDSVAIIAAHAHRLPYFNQGQVKGLARSMPTSAALDRVADRQGLEMYEVPTGWKFFGNLMDAGQLSICGEESFGTGSDHIREKDGLWAILAWLNVIAHISEERGTTVGIRDLMDQHYQSYGRNYFTRYDYEEVDSASANKVMDVLQDHIQSQKLVGQALGCDTAKFTVAQLDNFDYTDPIDGSVSRNQGVRIVFDDSSRIVFRLSGTGSQGATIRLYIDKYEGDASACFLDAQVALKPLIQVALEVSQLTALTGREKPTVIT
ncbi:hypothetical protein IWQ60_000463 [Tieghemiomyces parasiticus]|uniref:phosphoglucomutase (alpha-D-glucose-1,6-bisphosphate-dependent) n=1 Tax=Tieghemiomyces parasiticus TaxID=78921 RepID=A0A9W8AET5_9FUNG|nr:hypothetical protein IWQ60_000463 [Tieghemiomyces parasiticus]